MSRCALIRTLILTFICCLPLWAQDDPAQQQDTQNAQTEDAQNAYDDVAAPGQIHGFIPDTWSASMITLIDLQTQEGQDWFNGLTAAQSVQGQTRYVCQSPGATTTSADNGDFYFYDLPAGSYVIAGCMQTADGHWRSGAQVVALEAGQNELIALGPAGGPLMRDGEAFVPALYVGLWDPMWFGPGWGWGWHPATAWQTSVYYRTPVYRCAPLWIRPVPVAVGVRFVVPPYKQVVAGGYHYVAYRDGAFVRESPRVGVILPPKHEFHPVTPAMEARAHVQARAAGPGQVSSSAMVKPESARPMVQPSTTSRPSPFANYHSTTPVNGSISNNNSVNHNESVNRATYNGGTVIQSNSQNNSQNESQPRPIVNTPRVQEPRQTYVPPTPREEYHPAPAPREEYHAPPPPPRQEYRAPAPSAPAPPKTKKY
jgi:hypothetical protein